MIIIENEQTIVETEAGLEEAIRETIEASLLDQGVQYEAEVSVLLVDNEAIREINRDTRNLDAVTDVLSFPMIDYEPGLTYTDLYRDYDFGDQYFDGDALLLGDIVISLERALEQSEEYAHSLKREVCYLTVHSVLHLLGYDHMEEEDKAKMRDVEERILGKLAITRD